MRFNGKHEMRRTARLLMAAAVAAMGFLILPVVSGRSSGLQGQDIEKPNRFAQGSNTSSAAMNAFREGRDLIGKEEWARAAEKFDQIVAQYPKSGLTDAALYWSAFASKKQGKLQEAGESLARLIKEFPHST